MSAFWEWARHNGARVKWSPKGLIPTGHLTGPGMIWQYCLSRSNRRIVRISGPDGTLHIWRIRKPKSVKNNRMPRGNWWRQSVQWFEYAQKYGRLSN